jgi:hypothetical protein
MEDPTCSNLKKLPVNSRALKNKGVEDIIGQRMEN